MNHNVTCKGAPWKRLTFWIRTDQSDAYCHSKPLRAQRVSHALAAGTDWRGENTGAGLGVLLDLGHGIDNTTDEADTDGGNTGEGDWRIEEDETGHGNGQLVESANHRVCGGGGGADTPCGCV